ncbi:MAG: FAD-dependent monooxygenase, partial [Myxococcota bacterium]
TSATMRVRPAHDRPSPLHLFPSPSLGYPMSVDADLVIVGAGPAGASTALHLLHASPRTKVIVVERHRWPREKICAGAVGGRALKVLDLIGVHPEVCARSTVHGLGVVTPRGRQWGRRAEPIGWVIERREFDASLIETARQRGAEFLPETRVSAVRWSATAVELDTSRGRVRARAVVGADGVSSIVRRGLKLPPARAYAQAVEVDTDIRPDDGDPEILWFDVTDRSLPGYAWDFARTRADGCRVMCRGIYQLVRGVTEAQRHPDPGQRLEQRLRAQQLPVETNRFRRYAERGIPLAAPLARPRGLLVGEAAGIDPVLGEGIAQAIFGGAVAGPYLARALDQGDLRLADWADTFYRSRVGLDLRARTAALHAVYHPRLHRLRDRWFARSADLAETGAAYFGGEPFPWRRFGRSLLDLGRAVFA